MADEEAVTQKPSAAPGSGSASNSFRVRGNAPGDLKPDSKIGKYRVRNVLGRGGMGVVYAAVDGVLQREVALKILPDDVAGDQEALGRFLREARSAARFNHPNAVAVYDVGKKESTYFMAMELVRGKSAADILAKTKKPIPYREATRIIADSCRALHAAHSADLIHRDIKPGNILIADDSTVKLADFGLAKSVLPGDVSLTKADLVVGTPKYMSPEQCRNDPVDRRADIYSLGATYYTLLTGKAPYEEGTAIQILYAHCMKPTPDPREVSSDVPESVVAVINRAMAKTAGERYQTAAEMLADLEPILAVKDEETDPISADIFAGLAAPAESSSPVAPRRTSAGFQLPGPLADIPAPWAAAGAGVFVLLVGFLLFGPRGGNAQNKDAPSGGEVASRVPGPTHGLPAPVVPATETKPAVAPPVQPIVTDPPVAKTRDPEFKVEPVPAITKTEPPVTKTEPPVAKTEPPVTKTEPPVTKTEPPVAKTEPPVAKTEPPAHPKVESPKAEEPLPPLPPAPADDPFKLVAYYTRLRDESADAAKSADKLRIERSAIKLLDFSKSHQTDDFAAFAQQAKLLAERFSPGISTRPPPRVDPPARPESGGDPMGGQPKGNPPQFKGPPPPFPPPGGRPQPKGPPPR